MNKVSISVSYFKRVSTGLMTIKYLPKADVSAQLGFYTKISPEPTIKSFFDLLNSSMITHPDSLMIKNSLLFSSFYSKVDDFFQRHQTNIFDGLTSVLTELSNHVWHADDFKPINTLSDLLKHPQFFLKLMMSLNSLGLGSSPSLGGGNSPTKKMSRLFCMSHLTSDGVSDGVSYRKINLNMARLAFFLWNYHKDNTPFGHLLLPVYPELKNLTSYLKDVQSIPYHTFFEKVDELKTVLKSQKKKDNKIVLDNISQLITQCECYLDTRDGIDWCLLEIKKKQMQEVSEYSLSSQLMHFIQDLKGIYLILDEFKISFEYQRNRCSTPVVLEGSAPVVCAFVPPLVVNPKWDLSDKQSQREDFIFEKRDNHVAKRLAFNLFSEYLKNIKALESVQLNTILKRNKRFIQGSVFNAWHQLQGGPVLEKQDHFFKQKYSRYLQELGFLAFSHFLADAKELENRATLIQNFKKHLFLSSMFVDFKFRITLQQQSLNKWIYLVDRFLKFSQAKQLNQMVQTHLQQERTSQTLLTLINGLLKNLEDVPNLLQLISSDTAKASSYFQVALEALSENRLDHPAILAIFLSGNSTSAAASSSDPHEASFYKAFYKRFNFQYPIPITSLSLLINFYEKLYLFCFQNSQQDFLDRKQLSLDQAYPNISATSIRNVLKQHFSEEKQFLTLKEIAFFKFLFQEFNRYSSDYESFEESEENLAKQVDSFLNSLKCVSTPRLAKTLTQSFTEQIATALIQQGMGCSLDTFITKLNLFFETFLQHRLPCVSDSSVDTPWSCDGSSTTRSSLTGHPSMSRSSTSGSLVGVQSALNFSDRPPGDWLSIFRKYDQSPAGNMPSGTAWMQ